MSHPTSKRVILKVQLQDKTAKLKAMEALFGLQGVDSISIDIKEQKLILIGDIDPVDVVTKLRMFFPTDILSVGLATEPEKEKEKEKEDPLRRTWEDPERGAKEGALRAILWQAYILKHK